MFTPVAPQIKEKIIELHLAGFGRNQIDRQFRSEGVRVSHGTISNVIVKFKKEHDSYAATNTQSMQSDVTVNKQLNDINSPTEPGATTICADHHMNIGAGSPLLNETGKVVATINSNVTPRVGGPLSHLLNDSLSSTPSEGKNSPETTSFKKVSKPEPLIKNPGVGQPITNSKAETVPKKVYPRNPIEDRFLDRVEYYGHAQTGILNQIKQEKDRRRHELFRIDSRKGKLEEWRKRLQQMQYDLTARESNIKVREARIRSFEPYLLLAKKLCEMKLTLGDALHWIHTITEVAQTKNMDIKNATVFVAQELRQYRQLGGLEKKIERANQELTLINMAAIKKQEALTVVEDLINNKGITESQIIQLINFAENCDRYRQTNGNLQRPNNPGPGSNNANIPTALMNSNADNGYSMNDLIRLNLLKGSTTNMLNRIGTTHMPFSLHF